MKRFGITSALNFSAVLLSLLIVVAGADKTNAQDEPEPAKWSLNISRKTQKLAENDKFSAVLRARIEKGWHLYALEKIEGGPIPTRIYLTEDQPFKIENIRAPKPLEIDDTAFGVVTKFYEDSAEFNLDLTALKDVEPLKLRVRVYYQICNDEVCLPPKAVTVEPVF